MSESPARAVREFRRVFGCPLPLEPTLDVTPENRSLAVSLILEESSEVAKAVGDDDLQNIAKELADLLYVTYGAALLYGIDLDRVLDAVHRSNMTKLVDGKPVLREDGKILKPPSYEPPDIATVLEQQTILNRALNQFASEDHALRSEQAEHEYQMRRYWLGQRLTLPVAPG